MRLLIFSHHSALDGGASLSLLDLLAELKRPHSEIAVLNRSWGPIVPRLESLGVHSQIIPFEWSMGPSPVFPGLTRRLFRNLCAYPALSAFVRSWKPTHIYTNTTVVWIGAFLASQFRLPHIWHLREFGDADYDLHPDFGRSSLDHLFRSSSRVICNSQALFDHHPSLKLHPGACVIYNGVFSRDRIRSLTHAVATAVRKPTHFAIVGAIRPAKGQLLAIEGLARLHVDVPDATLSIVGDGLPVDVARCRELAANLGVSHSVRFYGFLDDPSEILLSSTACLMCSKREAFGRVTVEAMGCGCPVIATTSGGSAELISHGVNGLYFDGTAQDLALQMRAICQNPDFAREMGTKAQSGAFARFGREPYATSVRNVITQARADTAE